MKYHVTVETISHVTYLVEAESVDEANDLGLDLEGELVSEDVRSEEIIHCIPAHEAA